MLDIVWVIYQFEFYYYFLQFIPFFYLPNFFHFCNSYYSCIIELFNFWTLAILNSFIPFFHFCILALWHSVTLAFFLESSKLPLTTISVAELSLSNVGWVKPWHNSCYSTFYVLNVLLLEPSQFLLITFIVLITFLPCFETFIGRSNNPHIRFCRLLSYFFFLLRTPSLAGKTLLQVTTTRWSLV